MANDTITIFAIAVGVSLYNTMGNAMAKSSKPFKIGLLISFRLSVGSTEIMTE